MGLDMWADAIPMVDGEPDVDQKVELATWRKHHDLHGWMEALYRRRGGTKESFNLVPIELTAADLTALEAAILNRTLPVISGYKPPDDERDRRDLQFIVEARLAIRSGMAVIYNSWW